jgi:hypothetical protein
VPGGDWPPSPVKLLLLFATRFFASAIKPLPICCCCCWVAAAAAESDARGVAVALLPPLPCCCSWASLSPESFFRLLLASAVTCDT